MTKNKLLLTLTLASSLVTVLWLLVSPVYAGLRVESPTGSLDNGLVGYWTFDGADISGTNAYDRSPVGTNTGTITGATKTIGKLGQGLSFDGSDDYVNLGNTSSLGITGAMTVSTWVYIDQFGVISTALNSRLVSKQGAGGNRGWNLTVENGDDKVYFSVSSDGTNETSVGTTGVAQTKVWTHYVGVFEPSSAVRIYVNGTINNSNTTSIPASQFNSSVTARIGARNDCSDCYFDGLIDDVRVYNRALSAAEIKRLYSMGAGEKIKTPVSSLTSGLVGYWTFDGPDISGTNAYDRSPVGTNTGTISGASKTIGKLGQALKCPGGAGARCVSLSSNITLSKDSPWTISWISSSPVGQGVVFGNSNSYTQRISMMTAYGGSVYLEMGNGANYFYNGISMDLSKPHFYTLVYNNTHSQALYIDGSLYQTIDISADSNITLDTLGGGRLETDSLNGVLDDVRIYNRALSATEIKRLYYMGAGEKIKTPVSSLTSGLVGYWTFDGADISGTNAYDRSPVGTNTGTITGASKTIGKLGQALSFDGSDDYVNCGTNASLNLTSSLTLSAWVYPQDKTGYPVTDAGIVGRWNGNGYLLFADMAGASRSFRMYIQTTSSDWVFPAYNTWYHVVGTWDGSYIKLYANGSLKDTDQQLSISTANIRCDISNYNEGVRYMLGSIDDVRIYNRALSAAEIKRLYYMGR